MKVAVVIAWRAGETDLDATVKDATRSVGKGAKIITVEDKDRQGPARTRHRGIDAATDADVIIIADAHMRFKGRGLRKMAMDCHATGSLTAARCYHNEKCAFDGNPYGAARIVYRAKDGKQKNALAAKWARDAEPGPRGAIMGGCYAFPRRWYYDAGQPLSMLPGWGCDEEILSIAAWLSGLRVMLHSSEVAHLYRPRPPWQVSDAEHAAVHASRMALIQAVVTEAGARRDLEQWQRSWVPEGIPDASGAAFDRVKAALLKMPRKWCDWRRDVCEPEEWDGLQAGRPVLPADVATSKSRPTHNVTNPVVPLRGIRCVHCGTVHDPKSLLVNRTFPNGNRRHICPACRNPFISRFCL